MATALEIPQPLPSVSGFLAATPDDWEGALRTLLDDPDRAARMGEAGRRTIRERFDVRVVIPRVADLVESVVSRPAAD